MIYFGPLSSVFDFLTFGVMLWVFHAGPTQFRSGWFVESLATQTLVIFAIRTRRIPFFRSHPSLPLTLAALGVVTVGTLLPATPLAHFLGFQPLPGGFFAALGGMVLCYLALIEIGKRIFYGAAPPAPPAPPRATALQPTPPPTSPRRLLQHRHPPAGPVVHHAQCRALPGVPLTSRRIRREGVSAAGQDPMRPAPTRLR
jgi:hypothetical protein